MIINRQCVSGGGDGSEDEDDNRSYLERLEGEEVNRINPRHLVDALWEVIMINDPSNIPRFLSLLQEVATQTDPFLRSEVFEQIPKLAVTCVRERLDIVERLLLLVLDGLGDTDSQVRKTAQSALLVLVEQDLVPSTAIEEDVRAAILFLADDCFPNAIVLMGKLAQLLGKEATVRLFLDKFCECCLEDKYKTLREICARIFGEMCAILGPEITEYRMVPIFCKLCEDEKWNVRKACTEVLMLVSCSVPMESRRTHLTEQILRLLLDSEYWVRSMAYQVLGAFISTFADPPVTGLAYDPNGELIFVGPEGYEFRVISHQNMPPRGAAVNMRRMTDWSLIAPYSDDDDADGSEEPPPLEDDDDAFNTFQFWQIPLPDLEQASEDDEINANLTSLDFELASLSEKLDKCASKGKSMEDGDGSVISDADASTPDSGWNSGTTTPLQSSVPLLFRTAGVSGFSGRSDSSSATTKTAKVHLPQTVVPQQLLNSFIKMAQPAVGGEYDKEMALHCSYFLPAVASTLGPANWSWLADLYVTLSCDQQWKVRRTVACCLHDLAILIGEEQTNVDLAPVLKASLKDLDEVRIGALRNLAACLKLFWPSIRESFLPLLKEMVTELPLPGSDGDRNWRFREEVATQLAIAAPLFSPSDCLKFISPPAFVLLSDKIAAVRMKALVLMAQLLNLLSDEAVFRTALLDYLYEDLALNSKWSQRVLFAQLCSEVASPTVPDIVTCNNFHHELFRSSLLPHLIRLASDAVPNVRLCVARCLSRDLINSGFIPDESSAHEEILQLLDSMRQDRDRDVREAAHMHRITLSETLSTTISGEQSSSSSENLTTP